MLTIRHCKAVSTAGAGRSNSDPIYPGDRGGASRRRGFDGAQDLGWDPILPAAAYHVGAGIWTIVRPPSTLGYASYIATWLLYVVFLSLALPGRFAKACAVLAAIAMRLTETRAEIGRA